MAPGYTVPISQTLPETGTVTYAYDANSNLVYRTDARGLSTAFVYDELNRVVEKSYSDGTPAVYYTYDTTPPGSPIAIQHGVGRLTKMASTVSGVAVTNCYSYCACSAVNREATVINDGAPRTYITSYTHNLAGQLTSITYPNGKVVTYTRDTQGRETKVSSTYNGQAFYYIYSASYNGPQGGLTKITYPIYSDSQRMAVEYGYSPASLRLTSMSGVTFNYQDPSRYWHSTTRIHDITYGYGNPRNEHYEYDHLDRLKAYWVSPERTDPPAY